MKINNIIGMCVSVCLMAYSDQFAMFVMAMRSACFDNFAAAWLADRKYNVRVKK